jgi:cyanophycinase
MSRTRLLAIGGAEDHDGDCLILKAFVDLAGGPKAKIVLLTVATNKVQETIHEYRRVFRRLGVRHLKTFDVSAREDTQSKRGLTALKTASGLFFSGGDQLNIPSLIGGTEMAASIKEKYEHGAILAGTSAGAAMMSSSMLLSGTSEESPRFGTVEIGPGMEFLPTSIIDTHFAQRGRYGRLMTAVSHYPQDLGLGIDEDTAMLIQDNEFTVMGSGAVSVIDAGPMSHTNLSELKHGGGLELHGLTFHILPAGGRYDLLGRRPLAKKAGKKAD